MACSGVTDVLLGGLDDILSGNGYSRLPLLVQYCDRIGGYLLTYH